MIYRLVVLDIDGTIVDSNRRISTRLAAAIAEAQRRGAIVTLATGRMLKSALRFARELNLAGPVVAYQGAITASASDGHIIRHARLSDRAAAEAFDRLEAFPGQISVHVDGAVYARAVGEWARGYEQRMGIEMQLVPELHVLAAQRPTLILAVDTPNTISPLVANLRTALEGRALVTHSLPHFCEIASPEAGKALALDELTRELGVFRREVIAFGDGAGDASMLEWAGLGVAIDGGHPDALAAAGRTTGTPSEDGVAEVLEELLDSNRLGA